jgi:hypothetical protein
MVAGPTPSSGLRKIDRARPVELRVSGGPEFVGDDPQGRRFCPNPFRGRARGLSLPSPRIALGRPVVDHLAPIERPKQDLVHGRGRPGVRTSLLGARMGTFGVERLRDERLADAVPRHLEDAAHERGLGFVDLPRDVRTAWLSVDSRRRDDYVVVAEDAAAGDMEARAFLSIVSVTRCRAFSRSSSSANAVTDRSSLSVGPLSVRSRSSR